MKELLTTLVLAILLLVIIVVVIILISYELYMVMEYIPCEILVYIETGMLLGLFMTLINAYSRKLK